MHINYCQMGLPKSAGLFDIVIRGQLEHVVYKMITLTLYFQLAKCRKSLVVPRDLDKKWHLHGWKEKDISPSLLCNLSSKKRLTQLFQFASMLFYLPSTV